MRNNLETRAPVAQHSRRLPVLAVEDMTPAQRSLYDEVVAGPRGQMIGPLRAAIHSPELAVRWSRLGEFLRFDTSLPKKLTELVIIMAGRRWSAQVEWWLHARVASDVGLPDGVIDAILRLESPIFTDEAEFEVYEFSRCLQQSGQVPDAIYAAVERRWGTKSTVELTGIIGYYTMVAMTLNAHDIPVPDGSAPLPAVDYLCTLAPAMLALGGTAQ